MKKKTMFAWLAVLMVLGLVLAAGAALDRGIPNPHEMRWNHAEMRLGLGLSENATSERMWETMFDKRLTEMGLTKDSTIGELKAALMEQRQTMLKNMPDPPKNATSGGLFDCRLRPQQNATFEDMPTTSCGGGNRTGPMGRRGRGIDMMFGI
jgi:hypothetical protein